MKILDAGALVLLSLLGVPAMAHARTAVLPVAPGTTMTYTSVSADGRRSEAITAQSNPADDIHADGGGQKPAHASPPGGGSVPDNASKVVIVATGGGYTATATYTRNVSYDSMGKAIDSDWVDAGFSEVPTGRAGGRGCAAKTSATPCNEGE